MRKNVLTAANAIAVVIILSFIIIYKSITIPFTFDEVVTWERYTANANVGDIILNTDGSSNNHILNSLSVKVCQLIWGDKPWALRLPGILAFFLFAGALFVLAKKYFNGPAFMFCLPFACMFFNPYLLDFYSLARGYGMANAFMACSIVCMLLFSTEKGLKWYYATILFASLSAYSNFTFLTYWAAVQVLLTGLLLVYRNALKHTQQTVIITLAMAAAFILVCYKPLLHIQQCIQTTFGDRTGFYYDTILSTANRFNYGNPLFGFSDKIISLLAISIGVVAGVNFFLKTKKNRLSAFADPFSLTFILLLLVCVVNLAQVYLFKTSYLSGRTALIYYVLFIFVLIFLIRDMAGQKPFSTQIIAGMVTLVFAWHFAGVVNLRSVYEWSFDAYTCDVMDHLEEYRQQHPEVKTVELNLASFMHPSFAFYTKTNNLPWFKLSDPQRPGVDTTSQTLFYYTTSEHIEELKNYVVVKIFTPTGVLLPDAAIKSDQVLLMHK